MCDNAKYQVSKSNYTLATICSASSFLLFNSIISVSSICIRAANWNNVFNIAILNTTTNFMLYRYLTNRINIISYTGETVLLPCTPP